MSRTVEKFCLEAKVKANANLLLQVEQFKCCSTIEDQNLENRFKINAQSRGYFFLISND